MNIHTRKKGIKRILAMTQYLLFLPVTFIITVAMYVRMAIDISLSIIFAVEYKEIGQDERISAEDVFSPFSDYNNWHYRLYRFAIFGEGEYDPLGFEMRKYY